MPGTACRSRAMSSVTLCPGSCPPSPGLAPCTILISSSSARTRYSVVTPKRADATCLMRLSSRSPPAGARNSAGILAALSRIGLGVHPVHGDRERRMRLGRQGTERHGGRHETAPDRLDRFHLGEWHRRARADAEQVARPGRSAAPVLRQEAVVRLVVGRAALHRLLQRHDDLRRPPRSSPSLRKRTRPKSGSPDPSSAAE